jgi:hypothetical protein
MAWMISVDGFVVDARTMPPEVQAEARRRGLIPDLSTDGMGTGFVGVRQEEVGAPGAGCNEQTGDDGPAMGLGEAVRDVINIIRQEPVSESRGADVGSREDSSQRKEPG